MALPKIYVIFGVLIALIVMGGIGYLILQPPVPLVQNVGFSSDTLTPNADGESDIVVFSYSLARSATISLQFQNENGEIFIFRDKQRRVGGDYNVNFSGVVDGYIREGDLNFDALPFEATVERRLMPDGVYQWTFVAENESDGVKTFQGTLVIKDGDPELPLITAFEVSSELFTPNQDGIRDRIRVNVFLEKEADLAVYLEDANGARTYLPERLLGREPGEEGNHEYDYDGGVDDGFEPPEDGTYQLVAVAQDDEGQRVVATRTIEIEDGGLPQVEIYPQSVGATVCFGTLPWDDRYYTDADTIGEKISQPEGSCSSLSRLQIQQGDLLTFHLTVRNYGRTPIRTQGPFSGTVYEFEQLPNTLGYPQSDGAFRIGIYCDSAIIDHPWRWGLGTVDQLTEVYDPQLNDTFYYLEPGKSVVVWGAIRMTTIIPAQNPQDCSASLIHEGVSIDPFQLRIGVRSIEIIPTEMKINDQPESPPAPEPPFG
ncbi:MAG: hypothetical protein CUN55_05820 [Phototrophicales bacterium]|nr:MAG: hypothetical protein CUN55_05820 [Phototrophicales bacterium]